jgi:hypothetical protein
MASHGLSLGLPTTYISSKTQLQFGFNSLASRALRIPNRVSLSVRAMGSSASSQKPDRIQGSSLSLSLIWVFFIYKDGDQIEHSP